MLLRLLLIAGILTPLSLGSAAFWSTTPSVSGADILNRLASCAPTQPDEKDEEDDEDGEDNETPRHSTLVRFS